MKTRTDKERLDALQELTVGYGHGWMLRMSSGGRGLRLHETELEDAVPDVREAIDSYLDKMEKNKIYKELYEVLHKMMKKWDVEIVCAKSPFSIEEHPDALQVQKPDIFIMDYPDKLI